MEWTAPTSSRLSTAAISCIALATRRSVISIARGPASAHCIAIARGRGMRSLAASYARPSRHIA